MMDGMNGFGWFCGGHFMGFFFWILIVAGLVLILRWLLPGRVQETKGAPSAIEILDLRYARGEIDRGAWERMRKDLQT